MASEMRFSGGFRGASHSNRDALGETGPQDSGWGGASNQTSPASLDSETLPTRQWACRRKSVEDRGDPTLLELETSYPAGSVDTLTCICRTLPACGSERPGPPGAWLHPPLPFLCLFARNNPLLHLMKYSSQVPLF